MIYHFTDSARLPWILHDGILKPGRCRIGGFPDPDFLWATTSVRGDRTASGGGGMFKEGTIRLVRIALPIEDFTPWREAANNHPAWTADHIDALEGAALKMGTSRAEIDGWYCRTDPIPIDRFISVETRTWANNAWKPLPCDQSSVLYAKQDDKVAAGLAIEGTRYFSERMEGPNGRRGYSPFRAVEE